MLWAVCVRIVVGLHATWLVNSATHMWGARRFETKDDSRNSWWVALLTFGEGWHNNHHAHPTSARHGLAWYEFDISWISLKILRFLGIVKGIRVAKLPVRGRGSRSRLAGFTLGKQRAQRFQRPCAILPGHVQMGDQPHARSAHAR